MAVELRCSDCRAKLRLPAAPDAGTEVECPKCGTIFPAPEPKAEADEESPKKDDSNEKPSKEKKLKKSNKAKAAPGVPKKRKAKKRKASTGALILVISVGVLLVGVTATVLIWFFLRTPKSVEMMYYLPEDTSGVVGWNVGHHQKYQELYKSSGQDGLKIAGETIAKAAGTDFDSLVDYVIMGSSRESLHTFVYRTKSDFDAGALAKLPGAEKQTLDGKTYYRANAPSGGGAFVGSTGKVRVFAPTSRLIVVCGDGVKEPVFKKMLNGHADSREKTIGVRMGALGKRITRGTFWVFEVFGEANKPVAPPSPKEGGQDGPSAGGDDSQAQLARTVFDTVNGAKGFGAKASLGSREVRFELAVWYTDGEKSSSVAKKWKESELAKGDEGTPPKWFKEATQSMGDKKVATQILSNLSFGSSGDVFYAQTAVDTKDLMQSANSALGKITGQGNQGGGRMGPGGPDGGGGPGPGGPGPGGPGPGGPGGPGRPGGGGPGRPGGMRRRLRLCK